MLSLLPAVRIWLAAAPVDLGRSFDRLAAEVREQLHNDPLSGHSRFEVSTPAGGRVRLVQETDYQVVDGSAWPPALSGRHAELSGSEQARRSAVSPSPEMT